MTTTTLPQRRRLSGRWFVAGIILIAAAIAAGIYMSGSRQGAPVQMASTVEVSRGQLVVQVSGSGSVAAARVLDLSFQSSGTVTEVLIEEGDLVEKGQVLARLDDKTLQMEVENARLNLTSAMAQLVQVESGNATPQDIASAEANVRSAEAGVSSAQAQLNGLLAGPDAANIASSQASLDQARASLDQAQASLRQVQAGPAQSEIISARTELANAEATLQAAQAAYDKVAWRPEIGMMPQSVELQQATNNHQAAKARYDELMKGADPNDVASAQAQVRNAEAQVRNAEAQLRAAREGATQAEIAQARASVAQAQASLDQARLNLESLTAPQSAGNRSLQQISVQQAEQAVDQAELALENAVLTAPFAGIVSAVDLVEGGNVSNTATAVTLIDRSTLHIDLNLSENDVARVQLEQPVEVTIDSLGDWLTTGTVSYIAPAAEVTNDVVTYLIRVSFPDDDPMVKVGMTANVAITTTEKEDVLLIPNTALLPKGAGRVVQVPNPDGTVREVDIEVGLTNGTLTEVVSGLQEGDEIIALPTTGNDRQGGIFGGPPP